MSKTPTPADENRVRPHPITPKSGVLGTPARGPRIAFVAALEREVAPLIRTWKVRTFEHDGRRYRLFENGEAVLTCGGIGPEAARRAAEAVIREVGPMRIFSVGFAGALNPAFKVADIFEAHAVINANDGVRCETGSGQGTLVSYAAVAGKEQKGRLRKAYGADAVDMEAAAVAEAAHARGVEFGVLKAISDEADFAMPALQRFFTSDGRFQTVRFTLHAALRPWMWRTTLTLAHNSRKASRALSDAIGSYLERAKLTTEGHPKEGRSEFSKLRSLEK